MKKIKTLDITNLNKWMLALVLTVFINLTALAQEPGDFGGVDDTNPMDAPPSPIDDYVWILVVIAIGFALYKSRTLTKKTI